ncbi:GGDEF domain-containing protein [Pseudoalteromonas ruthenica]|uniref:sensor domain-containing diguanylate cyclase n=1 Tax=Pseudoalteromonas ruthenica TaxID=151081 RepID=UPI001107EB6A|nr:sensor domain-containing diguanylate cyclase [Pseudoalteromonas ruthenica]TLX50723.1 GGDEF domain-containing protein [Pseudoalteromonas ruthenica]
MFNKHSLILRLAIALVLTSLIVGVIAVKYYYRSVYQQEVEKANLAIAQLHMTVSSTASIAAYLQDEDLATEVISGLLKNDSILAAQIHSTQPLASQGEGDWQQAKTFTLYNPFFANEAVGQMRLLPAWSTIEQRARSIAQSSAQLLVFQTLAVLLTFTILAYFIITKPMARLNTQLKGITPGGDNRLHTPFAHNASEIGEITHSINAMLAQTERLFNQERALRSEVQKLEGRLRLLFEHAASAMILARREGNIILYNASTERLFNRLGIPLEKDLYQLVARTFNEPEKIIRSIRNSLDQHDIATGEYQLCTDCQQDCIWAHILVTRSHGKEQDTYLQIFINDITRHKKMVAELNEAATTDRLTGLFNRLGGEQAAQQRLDNDQDITLMLIDLDGFKPINDVYGHDSGDDILCHVATQLQHHVRKEDVCIRWGGDEFVIILDALEQKPALHLADKLREALSQATQLDNGEQVSVGASIGIATSPGHGTTLQELVIAADQAMYKVKNQQKNAVAMANI